jgi:branched-chain amino acid transport system substrate-binding protein
MTSRWLQHDHHSALPSRAIRASLLGGLAGLAVLIALVATRSSAIAGDRSASDEIVIGALLSLTGDWSTLGRASAAALTIAAEDMNAEFAATGSPTRVRVIVEDTRLDPALAREKAAALAERGARVIVGPQSSAEVQAVKPWADSSGVVLISQGSTASALSIAGDNVIRLVPDDVREAEALVALLAADQIHALVPAWRGDVGNEGLYASTSRLFEAAGGTVAAGVRYAPDTRDFSGLVSTLRAQVEEMIAHHGAGSVAIYLAAFDEVVGIFDLAQHDPVLSSVHWYGSDGVALSDALLADSGAARFAEQVRYPNPLLGVDERQRDRWQPIADRIAGVTGTPPDAFGLTAYDAAWIAVLAQLFAGSQPGAAGLRQAVISTANRYDGITGPTTLNEAGDRRTGNFDFWAVRGVDGGHHWVRVARYEVTSGAGGGGQIVR